MRLSEKQRKFTLLIARLIKWAYEEGYELTIGHVWRDTETQRRLVDAGLSKTMKSAHLDRLAMDFNLYIDGKYTDNSEDYLKIGLRAELIGLEWGGRYGVDEKDYGTKIGWDAGHVQWKEEVTEHGR